ncbi:pseudaminic acid synthase [Alteromonas sp. 5E99-2]|uniref:pseudaminic acid synthase n=1 Tax=Alteromonas sp. 5E99-2 TaxID=2817683 RepID=UPI001A9A2169|nr:pseudaminic acid synthase [Alteromonas sp. 5E99-2]MBO1255243.1 pseudaminic acid synthase [Alteromonas sp. 5E99-2]
MKEIKIGNSLIGLNHAPFIIAELSGNHQQNLSLAKRMIEEAANAGAHAIKLQTYTADSMTLDVDHPDFLIQEKESLWFNERLHSLYQKASTPYEWHQELFAYAGSLGLEAFSSPFDFDAVDFLETLDVPCYKIASFELTHLPLIKKVAKTGKPIIMSTGMASLAEIDEAVTTAKQAGCEDIILLKCTSTYPAEATNTHLTTLPHMSATFKTSVGLSDHTKGIGAAVASVVFGAVVIEKHFVLDRSDGGVDAAFSMEPKELQMLVEEAHRAWEAKGDIVYAGTEAETNSKQYRRSIYVSENVKKGDVFTDENLRIVRPAFGLAPKYWEDVLGRKAASDFVKGHALTWQDIS